MSERAISLKELAAPLGRTHGWLQVLAARGKLPGVFQLSKGGRWMILPSDVEKLLESLRAGGGR